MHNKKVEYRCRVCGHAEPTPPWGEDGKTPSFEYCDCCGVEFGYPDATLTGIRRYRSNWLAKGAPWFRKDTKPAGWNVQQAEEQLKHVPPEYR